MKNDMYFNVKKFEEESRKKQTTKNAKLVTDMA